MVLLFLPPYSPELQPVERLCAWLRSHYLSNRVYADYPHMPAATHSAVQTLNAERIETLCACS